MLVLSRKLGEQIVMNVGDVSIMITVVDIDRGKIRLGIDAPRNVPIFRRELIDHEREKAVSKNPGCDAGVGGGSTDCSQPATEV